MNSSKPGEIFITAARTAVDQLTPLFDPHFHIRRVVWAMNEISAKILPDPEIEAAVADVHHSLDQMTARLNTGAALAEAIIDEKVALHGALDALEAVLPRARPTPEA
eukprot:gene26822-27048_t